MGQFRVTFGFEGSNTGWTETHAFSNAGVTLPSTVFPFAIQVAQARVQMLGYPFQINAIRVSPYPKARAQLVKGPWANEAFGPTTGSSEPAVVALEATASASAQAPIGFANNVKRSWLGAPPIQCLLLNGAGPGAGFVNGAVLNLANNFFTWKSALINNGFGWFAVTPVSTPMAVVSVASLASGQVVFTVAGALLVDSTLYNIRVSGMNEGRSPLNRQFIALFNATTSTLTTKERVAFGTPQKPGSIQAYSRTNTFVPYGDIVMGNQTIQHKRGKPFLSPRGRAPKQIRW